MGSGASSTRGSASAAATGEPHPANAPRSSLSARPGSLLGAGVGDLDEDEDLGQYHFSEAEHASFGLAEPGDGDESFALPVDLYEEVASAEAERARQWDAAKARDHLLRSRIFPPPMENFDPFKEFTAQWVVGFRDEAGPLADIPETTTNEDGEVVTLSEAQRMDLAEKKAEENRKAKLEERRAYQESEAARIREHMLQCRAHILWLRGRSSGANLADPKKLPKKPASPIVDDGRGRMRSDTFSSWWRVAPRPPIPQGMRIGGTHGSDTPSDYMSADDEVLWRGDFVRELRFQAEARGMPLACISIAGASKHLKSVKGFDIAIRDHTEAVNTEGVYQLWSPSFVDLLEEVRLRTGSADAKVKIETVLDDLDWDAFPYEFKGHEGLFPPPPPVPTPKVVPAKDMYVLKKEGLKRLREQGELAEADHPTRPTFRPGEQPPLPDFPVELAKCLSYTSPVTWFEEPWKQSPAYAETVEMMETERRPQPRRRAKLTIADLI